MQLFHSTEELNHHRVENTIHVARMNGFDTIQKEEDGHTLCGKHGTEELVDVYPDGSWEFEHSYDEREGGASAPSGTSATFLGIYFANADLYVETMAGNNE
jgi:hypothetical protein